MMVFMPLVMVWIGQFCCDVIGCQNVKVVVMVGSCFCCYFLCLLFVEVQYCSKVTQANFDENRRNFASIEFSSKVRKFFCFIIYEISLSPLKFR